MKRIVLLFCLLLIAAIVLVPASADDNVVDLMVGMTRSDIRQMVPDFKCDLDDSWCKVITIDLDESQRLSANMYVNFKYPDYTYVESVELFISPKVLKELELTNNREMAGALGAAMFGLGTEYTVKTVKYWDNFLYLLFPGTNYGCEVYSSSYVLTADYDSYIVECTRPYTNFSALR